MGFIFLWKHFRLQLVSFLQHKKVINVNILCLCIVICDRHSYYLFANFSAYKSEICLYKTLYSEDFFPNQPYAHSFVSVWIWKKNHANTIMIIVRGFALAITSHATTHLVIYTPFHRFYCLPSESTQRVCMKSNLFILLACWQVPILTWLVFLCVSPVLF